MDIIIDAFMTFMNCQQRESESPPDFTTSHFKTARELFILSHFGGPLIVQKDVEQMKGYDEKDKVVIDKCHELWFQHCSAYVYLNNCDKAKYGSILKNLNQQHSFQNDQYPKSVSSANSVLSNHTFDNAEALARQRSNRNKQSSDNHKNESRESIVEQNGDKPESVLELSFAQVEGRCYCCGGKKGHKSPSCRRDKDKP
jgi:hypothetical protein